MRFLCSVAYDGSGFNGWQKQPTGRTIQQEIETVLTRINKQPIRIVGSGRTDAGVHAHHQCFHFDSYVNMEATSVQHALNALLPDDIRIVDVKRVSESFHARYDVCEKTYVYRLNCGVYDLFNRNYIYQLNQTLDLDAMREATRIFLGTHDFTSFNATPSNVISDQVRTLRAFDITVHEEELRFTLKGDGFLRYMVRMLVATCVAVGSHRISIDDIPVMLEARNKDAVPFNIGAEGLYLEYVKY